MKEKIEELIQQHKLAKQECFELISELKEISKKDKEAQELIYRFEQEYSWRGVFINQLEDLI